ncbi:MAG: hypothetical protein A2W30_10540 [Ignavibacteria bacterium RBG_16_36_9]|nr:MAG: hypothetical protein A2W30_10540 [Ignavibacteria bacterium RBG_16_36_9]
MKYIKVKPISGLVLVLTFLINTITLLAQEVIVNIQHPPFNELKIEDMWKITLINTSSNSLTVNLKGTLTEAQAGLIATGESRIFELPPGRKIFTGANYQELDPDIKYVNKDSHYQESITRTGGLPTGEYEICLYVIESTSGDQLGFDCIQQSVLSGAPPTLISPEDGSEISLKHPDFIWLPTVVSAPRVNYVFKMVERFGSQSVQEAIEKNSAYYITTLKNTMVTYPVSALELIDGKEYVWRVQSVDEDGNPVGSNNGYSEVWSFMYKKEVGLSEYKITRQEAIDIIIKKVIVPPTLDHDAAAFLGMTPMDSGLVYHPFSQSELEKKIEKPVWFGWINDSPQAFFSHSTRYVFIDASTGSYFIETYNWWPVVNSESLWMGDEEISNPDLLIYSTIHFK